MQLDYTVIDHAGGGGVLNSAITAKTPIQLSNSTISNSATWGLKKADTDPTDYLTGNTFRGMSAVTSQTSSDPRRGGRAGTRAAASVECASVPRGRILMGMTDHSHRVRPSGNG